MKIRYCSAALAYTSSGVMLACTNKKRTKWVFPKGGLEPGLTPMENAAKECYEETGYKCTDKGFSLGSYELYKNGVIHHVEVFALSIVGNGLTGHARPEEGRKVSFFYLDDLPVDEYLMPFAVKLQAHLDACAEHEARKENK